MLHITRQVGEDVVITDLNGKLLVRFTVTKRSNLAISLMFHDFDQVEVWREEVYKKREKEKAIKRAINNLNRGLQKNV